MAKRLQAEFVRMEAGGTTPPARSIALVPGAEVPVLTLDLPRGLRGAAREDVARRQLRDMTGLDADTLQLRPFHGPGGARGWHRALVAEAGQVAAWRDRAGRGVRAVLPDYLALPTAPAVWTFETGPAGLLARLGPDDGFAAPPGPARLMIARALDAGRPEAALVPADAPDWLRPMLEAAGVPVAATPEAVAGLGLPRPERLAHGELDFDLRADPLAERARLERRVKPWRWPLLVASGAAGLWAATQIVAIDATETAVRAARQTVQDRVRAEFVTAGPILDVRAQVSRALAEQRRAAEAWRGRTSPLVLFGQAAAVIDREGAVTEEVLYTPEQGLILVLRLVDFGAVDRLVAGLVDAGLAAEVIESRVSDGASGVRSEIRVGEGRT